MQQSSGFTADPVTAEPLASRQRSCDPQQLSRNFGEGIAGLQPGPVVSTGNGQLPFYQPPGYQGASNHNLGGPASSLQPPFRQDLGQSAYQPSQEGSPPQNTMLSPGDWNQQYKEMSDRQALINQLQMQMQLNQAIGAAQLPVHPQGALASLLSQQLQAPQLQEAQLPAVDSAYLAAMPQGWPGNPTARPMSPPPGAAVSPPAMAELQAMKHSGYLPHDDKKHLRGHGHAMSHAAAHGMKARQLESDVIQGATVEKLRREVARLHSELDRMEKEVSRQKTLRETERVEFTDAKERLKHSWAADRDDFARVKSLLKTKNAEHHAQSGRLSQQLKEVEAVNRGLRDLCMRSGLAVPPELEFTHSKHQPAAAHAGGATAVAGRGAVAVEQCPGTSLAASSSLGESRSLGGGGSPGVSGSLGEARPQGEARGYSASTPSETSYDSDIPERFAAAAQLLPQAPSSLLALNPNPAASRQLPSPTSAASGQPPSPTSAAGAVMAMMQQLPKVLAKGRAGHPGGMQAANRSGDLDQLSVEGGDNDIAAQAAAQAAAALGQLAAALSSVRKSASASDAGSMGSRPGSPPGGRPSAPSHSEEEAASPRSGVGSFEIDGTDLNRMSLQSWVRARSDRQSATPTTSEDGRSPASGQPSGQAASDADFHGEQALRDAKEDGPSGLAVGQDTGFSLAAAAEARSSSCSPDPPTPRQSHRKAGPGVGSHREAGPGDGGPGDVAFALGPQPPTAMWKHGFGGGTA